jgi:hypothetical protein
VSRDQRIHQSETSIQSLLNTNGASFSMTSHVTSALWTLIDDKFMENFKNKGTRTWKLKKFCFVLFYFFSLCLCCVFPIFLFFPQIKYMLNFLGIVVFRTRFNWFPTCVVVWAPPAAAGWGLCPIHLVFVCTADRTRTVPWTLKIVYYSLLETKSTLSEIFYHLSEYNSDVTLTCHTMVDGAEFWITRQELRILRKDFRWWLIQNVEPSTMWRQCDIWIGLKIQI